VTPAQALAFVERHGLVLQSARVARHGPGGGTLPSLAEAVAGGPIRGSWWGHPKGRAIYAACEAVEASADVLRCKLVDGKVTYVHRRLWPALARLAEPIAARLGPGRLDRTWSEHTPSGAHRARRQPFPAWVTADVRAAAARLPEADARAALAETGWRQPL
jgi:hypothetical protein